MRKTNEEIFFFFCGRLFLDIHSEGEVTDGETLQKLLQGQVRGVLSCAVETLPKAEDGKR